MELLLEQKAEVDAMVIRGPGPWGKSRSLEGAANRSLGFKPLQG